MFLILFIAAIACWLLLRLFIPFLRACLPDLPNSRSSHFKLTPRGGGVVFVLISIVFTLFYSSFNDWSLDFPGILFLYSLPLAFVSLCDDRLNLPSSFRFSLHVLTGFLLSSTSPLVYDLYLNFQSSPLCFAFLLLIIIISITAVINFVNFMDGVDGLVAGCMSVSIFALALSMSAPSSLWALLGALLGFLILNWSPASIFMGDVGSTFLGAVFAGLVLHSSSWTQALLHLLVLFPLLADAFLCVIRRLLAGHSVLSAHRLHLFQRLHRSGWSHSRVSSLYIIGTILLALCLLTPNFSYMLLLVFVEFLIGLWLDKKVAIPFDRTT